MPITPSIPTSGWIKFSNEQDEISYVKTSTIISVGPLCGSDWDEAKGEPMTEMVPAPPRWFGSWFHPKLVARKVQNFQQPSVIIRTEEIEYLLKTNTYTEAKALAETVIQMIGSGYFKSDRDLPM